MSDQHDDDWVETEFELNEQFFVPAGDGQPAKWMRKGDLHADEQERYAQGRMDAAKQHMERAKRFSALIGIGEARRRRIVTTGRADVTISEVLTDEEMAEFSTLKITLDAQGREVEKRQAAIDRDIAAGRYVVLRWRGKEAK